MRLRTKLWCGAVVALALPAGAIWAAETFTAGIFQLTLTGESAELIEAVEGGDAVGTVTTEPGAGGVPNKRLTSAIAFEPMSIRFQPGAPALSRWVNDGLPPTRASRSGVVRSASQGGVTLAERTFTSALITRVVFPKLDASGEKDSVSVQLVVQPTATTYTLVEGGTTLPPAPKTKSFVASNFRLSIDQLDSSGVATIAAIEVNQPLEPDGAGGFRATGYEVSNLVVSLNAATAETWFAWFDDFVVKGNSADSAERSGKIEYLSLDRKSVIATLELRGLGIVSIGAERADGWVTRKGAKSASGRVVAEFYVESVALKP